MSGKLWSDEEVEMLKTMSDAEIARETGRTVTAVRKKRYKALGHYANTDDKDKVYCPASRFESKETRIAKIIALAKRLGVKLLG